MPTYRTKGTCSRSIEYEINDNIITSVIFNGGCSGNTQGVQRLVEGRKIDDVIALLSGIQCRNGTSCPDQLCKALIEYKNKNEE